MQKCILWAFVIGVAFWLSSCQKQTAEQFAQTLINNAIATHGGAKYDKFKAEFDFRDRHYIVERNAGKYQYERLFKDSTGATFRDVIANDSTIRYRNGLRAEVPDSMLKKYRNSVNSVAYFALLPQPLNDPAAHKTFIGEATIKKQQYYKIKVTFNKEGGGKDFDDVFVYWIHQQNYTMDYFAYLFKVDGGGIRFREAINPQVIKGLRFQDYVNWEPKSPQVKLEETDRLFEKGQLKELSKIENKHLVVN